MKGLTSVDDFGRDRLYKQTILAVMHLVVI